MVSTLTLAALLAFGYKPFMEHLDNANQDMAVEEVVKLQPAGPAFNADSAYAMTKAQCNFGPRDMNPKPMTAAPNGLSPGSSNTGARCRHRKQTSKGMTAPC